MEKCRFQTNRPTIFSKVHYTHTQSYNLKLVGFMNWDNGFPIDNRVVQILFNKYQFLSVHRSLHFQNRNSLILNFSLLLSRNL